MQDLVPEWLIERLQEKNLIKFYSYWRIKLPKKIIACKGSDDFEIAFQLFQEYAESVNFRQCFKYFSQELKLVPSNY